MALDKLTQITSTGINSTTPLTGINVTGIITASSLSVSGITTGAAATFDSVDVLGVLTYDDVTNIDALGIVTARTGVHVTSGSVGIGTDSPTELLHLSADSAYEIFLERTGASPSEVKFANENNTAIISNNTNGIAFKTGATPSEAMRIEASGNVGIGTDNPQEKLHVLGTSSDFVVDTDASGLRFGSYGEYDIALVTGRNTAANSSRFYIENGDGEALRITANGDTQVSSGSSLYIANGNLVFSTSGTGIDFSANSNLAGMTGEVLDHYETGTYVPTWTNVVSSPTTYRNGIDSGTTSNGLSYVRIGNQVTITGAAFWGGATSINNTRPNMSLPFQARQYSVSGTIGNYGLGVPTEIHYLNYQNESNVNFFVQDSGGSHDPFGNNSSGEMYFDITYMTY